MFLLAFLMVLSPFVSGGTTEPLLHVRTVVHGADPPDDITLRVRLDPGGGDAIHETIATVDPSGEATLPVGGRGSLLVRPMAAGFWGPERLVLDVAQGLRLDLYPTGTVAGRITVPEGERLGEAPQVRFRDAGAMPGQAAIEDQVACLIDEDGAFRCPLPAGAWDLRVRSSGFVSQFVWNRVVEVGRATGLGTLTLTPGASVVGRVVMEEGEPGRGATQLTLEPQQPRLPSASARQQQPLRTQSAKADPRGFFHFAGIAPGTYVLRAERKGYVPAEVPNLMVHAGMEAELRDPLELVRPLTMRVSIDPPSDSAGAPWGLRAMGPAEGEIAGTGFTDATGVWTLDKAVPGMYHLTVSDGQGAQLAFETVVLEPDHTDVTLALSVHAVVGRVTLGDEPLAGATLYFGGARGTVSVPAHADEDGHFLVDLPDRDTWAVDVQAREPAVFRRLPEVPVRGVGSRRRVEVALPDTALEGEVVDRQGRPISDATVLIFALDEAGKPAFLSTDGDGAFALRGFGYGAFKLEARATANDGTSLTSRAVNASLSKASPTATVRIVVEPVISMKGQVRAGATPVAGADIIARFMGSAADTGLLAPSAQSDANGRFTLDVPPGAERLELFTMAPGFTFDRSEIAIQPEAEITVSLDTAGGVLRLRFDDPSRPRAHRASLLHDGRFPYALNLLARWAHRNGLPPRGAEWVLPHMPAGSYTFCAQQEDGKRSCREDYLSPGGEIALALPESSATQRVSDP